MTNTDDERADKAQRRLKGFGLHLLGYIVAMFILVPLNIFIFDSTIWVAFPLVGWGSVLAVHVAFVLGLFGSADSNQ